MASVRSQSGEVATGGGATTLQGGALDRSAPLIRNHVPDGWVAEGHSSGGKQITDVDVICEKP